MLFSGKTRSREPRSGWLLVCACSLSSLVNTPAGWLASPLPGASCVPGCQTANVLNELASLRHVTSQYIVNEDAHVYPAGLRALPGGVKFPDSAGAFHYEDSGKLLSVTSNRFIHWSVCSIDASTKSAAFLLACLHTPSTLCPTGPRPGTRCSWWNSRWTPTCSTMPSKSSSATAPCCPEESTCRRTSTTSSSSSAPTRASTGCCWHTPRACTAA